ncbi:TetR/AcrR family transcriptional regulator [Streptomyces cellulosae]|nr:TetR/AcrR family transcriptional regulator [Streptomyces cellulosae]
MSRWKPDARSRLEKAALELYNAKGFDATTVAEIAARAGLTERTFFRHFTDKREVLFPNNNPLADLLTKATTNAPTDLPPLEVITHALTQAAPSSKNAQTWYANAKQSSPPTPASKNANWPNSPHSPPPSPTPCANAASTPPPQHSPQTSASPPSKPPSNTGPTTPTDTPSPTTSAKPSTPPSTSPPITHTPTTTQHHPHQNVKAEPAHRSRHRPEKPLQLTAVPITHKFSNIVGTRPSAARTPQHTPHPSQRKQRKSEKYGRDNNCTSKQDSPIAVAHQ